jgi:hypothetical protein
MRVDVGRGIAEPGQAGGGRGRFLVHVRRPRNSRCIMAERGPAKHVGDGASRQNRSHE